MNNDHPTHKALLNDQPMSDEQVQAFLEDMEPSDATESREVQTFTAPVELGGVQLRALLIDGEPWFVASDVAAALGYSHTPHMVRMLDDDEAAVHKVDSRSSTGISQTRTVSVINESGLYSVILSSQRPEARAFKRWVTHKVLPDIRATGAFLGGNQEMHEHLGTAFNGKLGLESTTPAPSAAASVLQTLMGALLPLLLPLIPALLQAVTAWLNRQANPAAPKLPEYMAEPWFLILQAVCMEHPRADVARSLGVSAPFLSQVLNGSGKYGRGEASTHKLAGRVIHKFANVHQHRLPPVQQPRPRRTTVTVEQH